MDFLATKIFPCPYCGRKNTLAVDASQNSRGAIVVDCEVCCRPVSIHIHKQDNDVELEVHAENE